MSCTQAILSKLKSKYGQGTLWHPRQGQDEIAWHNAAATVLVTTGVSILNFSFSDPSRPVGPDQI